VPANLLPGEPLDTITSAEIVAAAPGGRTLVYTDSPAKRLGFVDTSRARAGCCSRPGGQLRGDAVLLDQDAEPVEDALEPELKRMVR
jgi:hypothetical protein